MEKKHVLDIQNQTLDPKINKCVFERKKVGRLCLGHNINSYEPYDSKT